MRKGGELSKVVGDGVVKVLRKMKSGDDDAFG